MRNYNNNILFSATDLNAFIECKHKAFLNFKSLKIPLQKKEDDAHSLLLKKKGQKYEAQYIQSLKESGCNIVEIPSQNTLEKRAEMTLDAMKSGADYIYPSVSIKRTLAWFC